MKSNALDLQTNKDVEILLVEDDYIFALNLQEVLESVGYRVIDIVDSAEVAIEKAAVLRPDLILMDIQLSGKMDGIQAAEQIWQSLQIPIIYVTGCCDSSTLERATLTYSFRQVLKPARNQELYAAIEATLEVYNIENFLTSIIRKIQSRVVVADCY
jgi:CheY-like chemotaxis protein